MNSGPGWAPPIGADELEERRAAFAEGRSVDQVRRAEEFKRRHPQVSITTPRENGTDEFRASWINPGQSPDADGIGELAHHYELRYLLDYLEARFDRGDLR